MAHGSKSRARTKERRLREKRARKAAQVALYEARRKAGQNKKSKRFVRHNKGQVAIVPDRIIMLVTVVINGQVTKAERKVHGGPKCRNIGCKRCSPLWN